MPFLIMFYPLIISTSILFTRLVHPLAMGLALLFQTILICCTTGLSNLSFWFSYILFLIFLGGMLVLFIYVTSLASNEMFKPSIISFMAIASISITGGLLLLCDPMMLSQSTLLKMSSFIKDTCYSTDLELVATIYNSTNMNMTIFMVFYLLLTLIVVVKVTGNFFGPLRLSAN
uniref:NADH dehydrogenase subunit 6 n=1 Tax=Euphausia crystallorophias TaxID=48141 RepID=UPI0028FCD7B9|nr:NADH dehydrogenase subunit 6 [Euphausia crystallorophias]WNI01992.1 NADH dehydrogenase subunit 6 [Euphausia crystallorophias]